MDNSDSQYSNFRDNIPYLLVLFVAHPLLRRVYDKYFPSKPASTTVPFSATNGSIYTSLAPVADERLRQRVAYDLAFAVFLTCILHGFSIVKILIIMSVNYLIATKLPRSYVVPMTWLYNVFVRERDLQGLLLHLDRERHASFHGLGPEFELGDFLRRARGPDPAVGGFVQYHDTSTHQF